jgi:hypothetical protein
MRIKLFCLLSATATTRWINVRRKDKGDEAEVDHAMVVCANPSSSGKAYGHQ